MESELSVCKILLMLHLHCGNNTLITIYGEGLFIFSETHSHSCMSNKDPGIPHSSKPPCHFSDLAPVLSHRSTKSQWALCSVVRCPLRVFEISLDSQALGSAQECGL